MKVRTIYLKVTDMYRAVEFWQKLLAVEPHKTSPEWHEFMVGDLRFALLLGEPDDKHSGSNCVPVFELADDELQKFIERAKSLNAKIIFDGLDDPDILSIVFADPFGNEFEFSKFHD